MLRVVRVSVLGAIEVEVDRALVDLGTRKQRALLAALAVSRGHAVSPDRPRRRRARHGDRPHPAGRPFGELGQISRMRLTMQEARDHAARLRMAYPLIVIVLDGMRIPWLAMAVGEVALGLARPDLRAAATRRPPPSRAGCASPGPGRQWALLTPSSH